MKKVYVINNCVRTGMILYSIKHILGDKMEYMFITSEGNPELRAIAVEIAAPDDAIIWSFIERELSEFV